MILTVLCRRCECRKVEMGMVLNLERNERIRIRVDCCFISFVFPFLVPFFFLARRIYKTLVKGVPIRQEEP